MIDNCVNATKQLLTLLNIKSTSKYLKDCILSHADHPSLLSISDTLEKYQIENLAVKIDINKLKEMPMPCITQVDINNESLFYVLKNVGEETVSYYDNNNKKVTVSIKSFLKIWSGICLLVEMTEQSRENGIEKKLVKKRKQNVLKGSIVILLVSYFIINLLITKDIVDTSLAFYIITYTVLKCIGLTTGVFLLWFEIDKYNPALQNFCSGSSKKINCNAVFDSKYAKLFNDNLTLSLLSFSYFFGSLFYLLVFGFQATSLSVLGIFSLACLPVILISIYFQALVIKQWCKFCIIIQAVLVSEIFITLFSKFYKNPIDYKVLPLLLALFLIPVLIWTELKPLLKHEKKTNVYRRDLKKIKNNPTVLESLLKKSRKIKTSTEGLGISISNNNSAKYNIVKVCNPYCHPCAEAHPILEALVDKGSINLQMLFTARVDSNDIKVKPVSHFLSIAKQGDKEKTRHALDDWYQAKHKDYDLFANKYPVNGELKRQNNKIQDMREWCDSENITHTPTIFINGYELPKEYSVNDLEEVLI